MENTPLSLTRYREIAEEIRLQPAWRKSSDKQADFYDGNQIEAEVAAELQSNGMGPLITNVVKPTVNALLGMEAKNRSDWRVRADRDEEQEVAEALSARLAEAERETRADQAISDAYAGQVKSGVGWIEVGRNTNPFAYPYRVESVHRREIFWDWNARKPDLSDARYLVRERWYPIEQVCAYLPEKAEIIKAAGSGWSPEWQAMASTDPVLLHAFDQESRCNWGSQEWRNTESGMIQLREVWYRIFGRKSVITLPNNRTVLFDGEKPAHKLAVEQGIASPREVVVPTLRISMWIGPHQLQDMDAGTNVLPYIPFWGYREDLTGIPYGVIRDMIPMQDEVNARRRKLLWLLSSKRVLADSDALDTQYNDFSDLAREVARPDAVVVLNPNRRGGSGVHIESDLSLSMQQYQVMQDSEQAVQRVAGIYNSMMGRSDGATSGIAINSLVEQGTTSVADINDNYRYARTLVGERLLALIIEDMQDDNLQVMAGEEGRRRQVHLNRPVQDELTGLPYRENDVNRVSLKVALSDVPSTPAYRQQQMVMLAETIKSLSPQLQTMMMPYYLEATDLPRRKELADLVRRQLGMDVEGGGMGGRGETASPDPEKEQMTRQMEAMGQQLQQLQQMLEQGKAAYEQQITSLQEQLAERQTELGIKASVAEAELLLKQEQAAKLRAEAQAIRAEVLSKSVATGLPLLHVPDISPPGYQEAETSLP